MANLEFTARGRSAGDAAVPRITALMADPKSELLHSITADGGRIQSWDVAGRGIDAHHRLEMESANQAGAASDLALLDLASGPALLATGPGAARLHVISDSGEIGTGRALAASTWGLSAPVDVEMVSLPGGGEMLYGGLSGRPGLAHLRLSDGGVALSSGIALDNSATHLETITALASVKIGSRSLLFAATDGSAPVLTSFSIGRDGTLTTRSEIGIEAGLWISAPTAMESLILGQERYLVLGAAGSGSLSVMRIGADGSLAVTDHLIDDRDSRFDGVTALATLSHRGRGFVVSGGADDGVSVHELLSGGRLVVLAHLADGVASGLADISALAVRGAGDGIDIFAVSASEPGVTRLRLDLRGGTLQLGSAGDEALSGGAGDDILRDGGGSDRLWGGAGADLFVLDADGRTDRIADFEQGQDRLDLSAWPMLRDVSQLEMRVEGAVLRLGYGSETLLLQGANGQAPDPALLTTAELIGGTHLPLVAMAGEAGPAPEIPLTPPRSVTEAERARAKAEAEAKREETAPSEPDDGAGTDRLRGGAGDDRLDGKDGDDRLWGGSGADRLLGRGGDDRLLGGEGPDRLLGGSGADLLKGQGGADRLHGGSGADRLFGGAGADQLKGKGGADRLSGGAGHDALGGGADADRLVGGAGNDHLAGGAGDDALIGGRGTDQLFGGKGADELRGGTGADRLSGGGGSDRFVFETGRDRIIDLQDRDRIMLDAGLWHGDLSPSQVVTRFAEKQGADTLFDFGGGDSLRVEDVARPASLIDQIEFL
ncbi:Hemolysin, chromosomal [Limimaricola soesokkakensis]|uniref:Hemolysin, chromosomal n=1 Tax=Limimaricola soesokkakensis TaxID=1343159 RepID=A0A1X7A4K7_9RHOB|nr:calcium-binding protein [Limimaricola soesokkakensis]SLN68519.1 Hemolysin, chromosomal [Limimaricola soesokkakensis]